MKTISNPPNGKFRTRADAQGGGYLAALAAGATVKEANRVGLVAAGVFDMGVADGKAGKNKASVATPIEWGSERHAYECGYAVGAGLD